MRKLLVLTLLLGVSVPSFAARLIWDCESGSDPDKVDVQIYREGKKYLATLHQYYGDGDGYAEDLIEVSMKDDGNDSVLTFEQVPDVQPRKGNIRVKPTRKTAGAVLRFTPLSKDATIQATEGPAGGGEIFDEGLTCTQPQRPQQSVRGACIGFPGTVGHCIYMDKKTCEAVHGLFAGGPC